MSNELRMSKRLRELAQGLENGSLSVHSYSDERHISDVPNDYGLVEKSLTGGAKLTITVLPNKEIGK